MLTHPHPLLFITFVILFTCFFGNSSDAQTILSGTITSLNGEEISHLVITPQAAGESNLFDRAASVRPDKNGRYQIEIEEPGIYTLQIRALHHQSLYLPIMIFDQDQIDMDLRLVPRPVNDGTYFSKKPYRKWIRAYGNFNDYDYHSGISFEINMDGSISTRIPVDRDIIRYQVRGITSGQAPLPDEQHTHLRDDGTFEGIIIPPADTDSVELRFDPSVETRYTSNHKKLSSLPSEYPRALLSFKDKSDFMWVQPLSLINRIQLSYELFNEDSFNSQDSVPSPSNMESLFTRNLTTIKEHRKKIEADLDKMELHPQQRAALYIAYLGLVNQEERWTRLPWERENENQQNSYLPEDFFQQLLREVHPLHPLWARNPEIATLLLTFSNNDPHILAYTRQMVREHPDDLVVRNLVIKMIEAHADQYKDAREMPEYQWIIERYGEHNLARKAIAAFLKAKQDS